MVVPASFLLRSRPECYLRSLFTRFRRSEFASFIAPPAQGFEAAAAGFIHEQGSVPQAKERAVAEAFEELRQERSARVRTAAMHSQN